MTKYKVLEAALDERYEYLLMLRELKELIDQNIQRTETEVDSMLIKILSID